MTDARIPRQARVRARAEFDRVFKDGRRLAAPLMALHVLADDAPARLGLAVSRKVDKHAVGRNRIKRVLRDEFRKLRANLPAGAYVIVARPPAAGSDNPALRAALVQLLQRAGALQPTTPPTLPVPGAGGTMRAATSAKPPSLSTTASAQPDGPSLPAR